MIGYTWGQGTGDGTWLAGAEDNSVPVRMILPPADIWRPVIGYEGRYEVSHLGRVRSLLRAHLGQPPRLLAPTPDDHGYPKVTLSKDSRRKCCHVHNLVAAAFIGPRPAGHIVHHKDDRPDNPRASNLTYVTYSKNLELAYRTARRGPRAVRT